MIAFNDLSLEKKVERWEQVLRVLKALTPHERKKHWDMAYWGRKTDCGTVACAAGHCAMDPWFTRRGLKLRFTSDNLGWIADVGTFFGNWGAETIFYNDRKRTVRVVIQEVKNHIEAIKSEEDPLV